MASELPDVWVYFECGCPFDVMTFDEMRRVPLFPARMVMWTAVAFGIIALMLTVVGLYGVVSTSVVQRTREFGVRIALGARPADILRGVLREAGVLVLFGAAGGLVAGYLGARVLESIMTGAGTFDPVVSLLIAVGLALLSAAVTFAVLTGLTPIAPTHMVVVSVLSIDALASLLLLAVIGREVWLIVQARRRGRAGARLHVRIIGLFSIIAAVPAGPAVWPSSSRRTTRA